MRTPHKHLKTVLVVLALAVNSFGQQSAHPSAPSVERLRTHIEYLASDKLQGRRTGTQGANDAARYIADEFKRLGLKRVPREVSLSRARGAVGYYDSYLQPFPYIAGVELGKQNELSFRLRPNPGSKPVPLKSSSSARLVVGEDWMPLGLSSQGRLEKLAGVFVGYGITSNELNHDDYVGGKASGKIAIAFAGTPDAADPHGKFARFKDVRWKAIAARNAGARALVVIADATNFKEDRHSRLRYDNSAGDAGLPVIVISRQAAERLLSANSSVLLEIEGRLSGKQPASNAEQVPALPLQNVLITLSTDVVRREVHAANVIGVLEGSDPTLKNEAIVLGAHYDHLGLGGEGSLAPREGEIHHGADDNASGLAGILELARFFTATRNRPRRTLLFMAFGGEEGGLLGSNYYVNHPVFPLANTVAMLNMDMIGRMKNNRLIVGGVGTAENWREFINSANTAGQMNVTATGDGPSATHPISSSQSSGKPAMPIVVSANGRTIVSVNPTKLFELTLNEDGFGPSDHSSFYAKKIPVLFFWTGTHDDYHKPSDTAEKINYEDEARILNFVARVVRDIDTETKRPTYTVAKGQPVGRTGGFSISLGTIPSYADSTDGLLIDGVRDDSPAAKAGIKAGDKIVKLATRDIRNVYDYTAALGEMKAGQEYDVELMRNGERLKLKIIPAARR